MHAFVDESIRGRRYLLAVAIVEPRQLGPARRRIRAELKPGQRRIHMSDEGGRRQRALLALVAELDVAIKTYVADGPPDDCRRALLEQLTADLVSAGASRLVIESRPGRDQFDRRVLARSLAGGPSDLVYEHMRSYEEMLLALPDIAAWAIGAGGDWRRRASFVEVVRVES